MKVGVQLGQQHVGLPELRQAWMEADESLDSIWVWDHFFPLSGDPDGTSFECWSLLAAMAVETSRASIGPLVCAASYRNPHLLADIARTVDHLSGGRLLLGVGAGWFKRDYQEYGYTFGAVRNRVEEMEHVIAAVRLRLEQLRPPPLGPLPILVGGGGEQVVLPAIARTADWWNCIESPADFARKSRLLDEACERVGRAPSEITRTVAIGLEDLHRWAEYAEAGAAHLIVGLLPPYDIAAVADVRAQARGHDDDG